jgi:hypothetical protein
MPRKKLPYGPGDVFAIPLADGGFAVCLAARIDGGGTVLGYFFRPRRDHLPTTHDVGALRREDSFEVAMFGDLGLIEGRWPVLGTATDWKAECWPVPTFGRIDIVSGNRAWRVQYRDPDLKWMSDEEINVEQARTLPRDRLMGAGAVEAWLSHLLAGDRDRIESLRPRAPARART